MHTTTFSLSFMFDGWQDTFVNIFKLSCEWLMSAPYISIHAFLLYQSGASVPFLGVFLGNRFMFFVTLWFQGWEFIWEEPINYSKSHFRYIVPIILLIWWLNFRFEMYFDIGTALGGATKNRKFSGYMCQGDNWGSDRNTVPFINFWVWKDDSVIVWN